MRSGVYIYQIEVSNFCSLTCAYCPHPTQIRPKGFMSFDTFRKCVDLFKDHCDNRNTLRLHNFGEVALHPELPQFIQYARTEGVACSFFTNGMRSRKEPIGRGYWQELSDAGLETVDFSAHVMTEEEFRTIVEGIVRIGRVYDPKPEVLGTWAGQVGPPEIPLAKPCIFERMDAFVVLWDGRISSCCLDVEGQFKGLHVDDLLAGRRYRFASIPLCSTCSSMRHEEML